MQTYEEFKNELREQVTFLTEHDAASGPSAHVVARDGAEEEEPEEEEEEQLSEEVEALLDGLDEEKQSQILAVMGQFRGGQRRTAPRGAGGRFQ